MQTTHRSSAASATRAGVGARRPEAAGVQRDCFKIPQLIPQPASGGNAKDVPAALEAACGHLLGGDCILYPRDWISFRGERVSQNRGHDWKGSGLGVSYM